MKVLFFTREYPPHVYGGAGVHVEHLARELARKIGVEVRCFGDQREEGNLGGPAVRGFAVEPDAFSALDPRLRKALEPLAVNTRMLSLPVDADLAHCHTWYSLMAGLWAKILYGVPLVVTTHSLEPLRPWKEEQLGRGYHLSSWIERTAVLEADAVIAVSEGTRREVLQCYPVDPERVHVIHNGVDPERFRPVDPRPVLVRYGIPPDTPYILFVGRLTRQKGLQHLLRAIEFLPPELGAILCAGAPDTEEIERETETRVEALRARRGNVWWFRTMIPVDDLRAFYSGALVFVCPSVYEPFGIINLEAMACGTPVVATRVGGIPEVVEDGRTGILVDFEAEPPPSFEPRDPEGFARALARAISELVADPDRRRGMGEAARARVLERFTWERIAERTIELYRALLDKARGGGDR